MMATQLLLCSHAFSTEIIWRKELKAEVDHQEVDCALAGGMEFCKPAFVDIDADDDPDMFVGDSVGTIRFFRNEGTLSNPRWNFVSEFYDSTIGKRSSPTFADIDADGDPDLLVGNKEGKICLFRNDGNVHSPIWNQIIDYYNSIDVGSESTPVLVDIDADSDFDLFIGKDNGNISFYRNVGTKILASWYLVTESYDSIDVGSSSIPIFTDLDGDGDLDLFVGEDQGNINYYRNIGNKTTPDWELFSDNYNSIDVGKRSSPAFADLDDDSDLDLFIGQDEGKILFFRNDGSIYLPSWTKITETYLFMDIGAFSKPALADVDGDSDQDLFVGEEEGNLNFYRQEESLPQTSWSTITENYFAIQAGEHSSPAFVDIDGDADLDLFIGKSDGRMDYYENMGDSKTALWNLYSDYYNSIDVGSYACPVFADIDHDNDLDLFVGQMYGKIFFYRNDGTSKAPFWSQISEDFDSIDVGGYSVPAFGDLDLDGDYDLLVGNGEGRIYFFRNEGTPYSHSYALISNFFDSIDVGDRATPVLSDFDSDGDWDLFIGESKGGLCFFRNPTLNSIGGKVTDGTGRPLINAVVYLIGLKSNSTFTDSSGSYEFVGLPWGDYCVFRVSGSFKYCFTPLSSDTFDINFVGTTDVEESSVQCSPEHIQLFPNYPNPFNPTTIISYFLPADEEVSLTVYNLIGEKVRVLANGFQTKGEKKAVWDGKDSQGHAVASGIYFSKLRSGDRSKSIKMLLLK